MENKTLTFTSQSLANKLKVSKDVAYKFLSGCVSVGIAKSAGKEKKPEGSSGKPSNVYELDSDFRAKLLALADRIHA